MITACLKYVVYEKYRMCTTKEAIKSIKGYKDIESVCCFVIAALTRLPLQDISPSITSNLVSITRLLFFLFLG